MRPRATTAGVQRWSLPAMRSDGRRRTAARVHVAVALAGLLSTRAAPADGDALPALLPKLSAWSARFESMLTHAAFTMSGGTEEVDGDGEVSNRKEGVFRVNTRGARAHVEVVRYSEAGEDKTREARERVAEQERERANKPRKADEELHMPFLSAEEPKYVFRIGETDPRAPTRVRVYFTAKHPAKNLGNGSAWVDTQTGDVLSMGVSPSKTSLFVDYINVTLEFGENTSMGPALSRIRFEARGGFLFFRKKVRGMAVVSDYEVK